MTPSGATSPTRIDTFENEGLTFSVADTGPIDGEVIILLHGFPQTGEAWEPTAAALNEAGYRTLAPTLRGYETSSRARGRWRYRSSRIVSDVVALIGAAGGRPVHLIGHDWGSLLAWSAAAARPDLISSLTAVSVPHYAAYLLAIADLRSKQLIQSYYIVLFQLPLIPELLFTLFPRSFDRNLRQSGMADVDISAVNINVVESGALTSGINWYRGLLVSNQRAMTRKITVPTTFVWGDEDTLLGRTGTDLTKRFVTGSYNLEVFAGASHWIPAERPQELADAFVKHHPSFVPTEAPNDPTEEQHERES
ncbi:alpha/beta fold hydrolase [Subtercola endophyticus]|uniref:alpha/beta fold hydrolase n=1 Tax=Subtercola endophyticus TaxID=2895559 RepID=UPI001E587A5E|nr:alpha/beta fold hydrolase [Subtercola endophyticus]UFS60591.1 alpha/beta fold hydrolase [Subtercola endophyticus]